MTTELELTPGQKAAKTRARRAAGQKAAATKRGITPAKGKIMIQGRAAKRGERMTKGSGWRLATTKASTRVFVGTLLHTINMGNSRLAIFSVPK
jgi:hypothetical protein